MFTGSTKVETAIFSKKEPFPLLLFLVIMSGCLTFVCGLIAFLFYSGFFDKNPNLINADTITFDDYHDTQNAVNVAVQSFEVNLTYYLLIARHAPVNLFLY